MLQYKKDDVILIESVIYYCFEKKEENITQYMHDQIAQLAKKGNPFAMYNLATLHSEKENISGYSDYL